MPTLNKLSTNKFYFLFGLAFLIRLVFILLPGHQFDLNTFRAWGANLNLFSPTVFFQKVWSDYLPLPLLLTKVVFNLANFFHLPFALIWKSTLVCFELILLYTIAQFKPFKHSFLALSLLLFTPIFLINGAWWGQVDALVSLALLLSFLTSLPSSSNFYLSLLTFVLAFSFKPLVLLALPFLLLLWSSLSFKKAFLFLFLFSFLSVLPGAYFIHQLNPLKLGSFLFHRLIKQASTYPYTTINAFNFWSIRGNFWQPDTVQILGINAHTLGLVFFFLFYFPLLLATCYKLYTNRSSQSVFPHLIYGASLALILFYIFATRMHERHLLYGLPLLLLLLNTRFKSRAILDFSFFSLVFIFNNLGALFWLNHHTWPFPLFFIEFLSFSSVLFFIYRLFQFIFPNLSLALIRRFILRYYWPFCLFLLAFLLRLVNLSHPHNMIFDEVYHAFTAREFVRGDNLIAWEWWHQAPHGFAYEWTHPPLAKYGMVLGMLLFGQNAFGWRFFSALFGALTIVLTYLLGKRWFSPKIALTASFLLMFDGLHLVQSRIAMNDIYLLFFILLTLYLASYRRWRLAAFSFGLALASKWSALYLLIPLSYLFFQTHHLSLKTILLTSRFLLLTFFTYLFAYFPFFLHHSFSQFIELQRQMWLYHTHLKATHPYQSRPWQWVLGLRPVWYYTHHFASKISNIYAQSNPFVLSFGFISLLTLPLVWSQQLFLPLLIYFSFWLPWLFSPRIMFFYHYLPSLPFFYLWLSYLLYRLPKFFRYSLFLFWGFGFVFFLLPSIYAIPLSQTYWHLLFTLFPSWQ